MTMRVSIPTIKTPMVVTVNVNHLYSKKTAPKNGKSANYSMFVVVNNSSRLLLEKTPGGIKCNFTLPFF
jgi:hypothetical protein